MERMTDFFAEPSAERIALNKEMETEPPGKEYQHQQDGDEDQKTNAFHANEIKDCGVELVSVAGRRLSRLFGDLVPIASGVVKREQEFQELQESECADLDFNLGAWPQRVGNW